MDGRREEIIEWKRLAGAVRRRWMLVLLVTLTGVSAAWLVLTQVPDRYQAEAQLVIEGGETAPQAAMLRGMTASPAVHTAAEILRSRALGREVVARLKLTADPRFNPLLKAEAPGWKRWLSAGWRSREAGSGDSTELAVNRYLKGLAVMPSDQSQVITVRARFPDPLLAARIANTVVDLYIERQLARKESSASRTEAWLGERAEALRAEVLEAQGKLEAFRREYGMMDVKGASLYAEQLAQLNFELIQARNARAEAASKVGQLQALLNEDGGMETAAAVLSSPLIQNLRAQEATVLRKLGELKTLYREKHPKMKLATAELNDLQAKIRDEVEKIIASLRNELSLAQLKERNLEAEVERLQGVLSREKEAQVTLSALESEAHTTNQLYQSVLAKFREMSGQEALHAAGVRVISPATIPLQPVSPPRTMLMAMALLLAAGGAVMLAVMLEMTMKGFHTRRQLEEGTGLSVQALLPEVTGRWRDRKLSFRERLERDALHGEAIRELRAAVMQPAGDKEEGGRVIMLTSSLPEEGKSTTSYALARVTAMLSQRCLLIDADLRLSKMQRLLKAKQRRGLGDYLSGQATLREILYRDPATGVFHVPAGMSEAHPMDLLSGPRMERFLNAVRAQFDVVLMDAPPVLAVGDAQALASKADRVFYLVRWEKTPGEQVAEGLRLLREQGKAEIGLVLSRIDPRKQACYRYAESDYTAFSEYVFDGA